MNKLVLDSTLLISLIKGPTLLVRVEGEIETL
jgi:hypothetical protein